MPIELEDLRPFFQVIVYSLPEDFVLANLARDVQRHVTAKNNSFNKFAAKRSALKNDNPIVYYYEHKFPPSWYRVNREGRATNGQLRNVEHDVLFLYEKDQYLFVHATCEGLLSRVSTAIERFQVNRVRIKKVSPAQIKKVLDNTDVHFSSVGIDNVFNAGGTAPEAKAYHGRAANLCLTPSFDTGFGFGYCIGRDLKDLSRPFGCSTAKRKVWRTWVDNIDEFVIACDKVAELMNQEPEANCLDLLVTPISHFDINTGDIICFYIDYFANGGSVRLRHENIEYVDWASNLDSTHSDIIVLTLLSAKGEKTIELNFAFDPEELKWNFAAVGDEDVEVLIANENGDAPDNNPSLVEYLNRNIGFTIIFTEGRAFRNASFWKDNRFQRKYRHTEARIDKWENVNIKRESKEAELAPGKMTILKRLGQILQGDSPVYLILDDDANETADYLAVYENRLILAHAKASQEATPGLRVDDLHVVSSQAIKNLRFFVADRYSDTILARLHTRSGTGEDFDTFKSRFMAVLNDTAIDRECWIVQPGISLKELKDSDDNKIHCLLNYVDGSCMTSNVRFRLVCSA